MTRLLEFSIGEFYHIYNRGTDKRKIFITRYDYERFITLLYLCNSTDSVRINLQRKSLDELLQTDRGERLVDIGAYCLMPNHFHLLLHEKSDNGISRFLHKLTTAYTMYFNKKNDRSGSLFQGVFKAEHADTDEYLNYLFAYINLNPVKLIEFDWKEKGIKNNKQVKNFLSNYQHSSYLDHLNTNRKQELIINKKAFPDYFEKTNDFEKMIDFWLNYKNTN